MVAEEHEHQYLATNPRGDSVLRWVRELLALVAHLLAVSLRACHVSFSLVLNL